MTSRTQLPGLQTHAAGTRFIILASGAPNIGELHTFTPPTKTDFGQTEKCNLMTKPVAHVYETIILQKKKDTPTISGASEKKMPKNGIPYCLYRSMLLHIAYNLHVLGHRDGCEPHDTARPSRYFPSFKIRNTRILRSISE